jgi:iron complex outermembrane receptor protein
LIVLALASSALADDFDGNEPLPALTLSLKRMSVEELLAQQITSVSRKPESWSEAASNVFLIRGQAVQATGASTLPDLLRTATNLFVAQSSSSAWAINARGFVRTNGQSNKLLVTIDGRTVYSPLFSNVFWDATSVFLPDIDHIEVISGPAGASWGANAVNGVISIESKSAHDTLGGLITATTGTQEEGLGVRYGAKFGETGAFRLYVQRAEFDATLSATGVDDDLDAWKSTQGGFRADWGNEIQGAFTVQGDLFSGRYQNGAMPDTVNDGANLLARWSRELSPDSHLWVRVYHDYSRRNTQSAITETTHTTDLEFQHHLDFANGQEFLWGGNYRTISDSIDHTAGFVILPPDLNFSIGSVFGQHEIKFVNNQLRLTTGLRLEHNYFSGWEYQPSIRLAWVRPGQTYWLSASRATRIPSRLDTGFFAPDQPPYYVTGGPDFTSEILHAYELGWRGQPASNLSLTATVYYHNYDRLRSIEPNGAAVLPYVVANQVAGSSYGVEAFMDWDVSRWWRMRAGGFTTEQNTHLTAGGADTENGLGEASFPKYEAQLRNSFRLGNSWNLWTSLRRVAAVSANESGGGEVPAYTELDANLNWIVRTGVEVSFTGRNLLDASHPEIGGLDTRREIQRSLQVSVRWNF